MIDRKMDVGSYRISNGQGIFDCLEKCPHSSSRTRKMTSLNSPKSMPLFPSISGHSQPSACTHMGISESSLCIEVVCVHVSMRAATACWRFAPASIIIVKTIELLPTSTPSRTSPAASSVASKMPLPENGQHKKD
jgi:hypothetical protein